MLRPANQMLRWTSSGGHGSGSVTCRTVKYIANSAAKNISSDDSQTMVPTLTKLGRLGAGMWAVSAAVAVATTRDYADIAAPLRAGAIVSSPGLGRSLAESEACRALLPFR